MSINPTVLIYLGAAALLVALVTFVTIRVRFWIAQGELLVAEPGHRTPHVTFLARLTRLVIATAVKRWYVGPVRVRNKKALKFKGRLIIVLNHQTERDAIVVPAILQLLPFRALMAVTQIIGARKALSAWLGIIAVHHDKNPAASLRTSIDILQAEEDTSFVVFPQGALKRTNELKREEFFDGIILIGKKVQAKSKKPFAFVCGGIAYDRNPAHKTWCQKFWSALGLAGKREFYGDTVYGAAVVWSDPILVSSLPDKRDAAMDIIFANIKDASDEAHRMIA